ncbi:MAG: hypothetical protein MK052_05490 [Alphaproteobacteria bacterium]|nr:hypothetical protein [Alphaproteobacteria bacterium]
MQDSMFYRITDFAFPRNAKQALGFYLFHLAIGLLGFVAAVVSYKLVVGLSNNSATLLSLSKVSSAVSLIYVGFLSYKILEAKRLMSQPKLIIIALGGMILAVGGMLLGLVVVACLSILTPVVAKQPTDNNVSKEKRS